MPSHSKFHNSRFSLHLAEKHTFSSKERDVETGLSYFGARYYSSDLSIWLSVDPMSDKYPSLSPYTYCANNPVKLVDPNGEEIIDNPILIFNGVTNTLQIFEDNNTPDDFSDDCFLGEFDAHNNTDSRSQGKWEDGRYSMLDTKEPQMHGDDCDSRGIKKDSPNGAYGEDGIFRAKDFTEKTTDKIRRGMGIHAGRENKPFKQRYTMGCIRTTPKAMRAIKKAIQEYGALTYLYVQNNRTSPESPVVNNIVPIKQYRTRDVVIQPIRLK